MTLKRVRDKRAERRREARRRGELATRERQKKAADKRRAADAAHKRIERELQERVRERLQSELKSLGGKTRELERLTGVPHSTIAQLLNGSGGRSASVIVAARIAEVASFSLDWLVFHNSHSPRPKNPAGSWPQREFATELRARVLAEVARSCGISASNPERAFGADAAEMLQRLIPDGGLLAKLLVAHYATRWTDYWRAFQGDIGRVLSEPYGADAPSSV